LLVTLVLARSGFDLSRVSREFSETAGRARDAVAERSGRLFERARETQNDAGDGRVSERVAVYFGPASHVDTNGIDDRFLAFLRGADESILCAFYDVEWMDAARVLIDKHRAGLTVRIVSDSDYEQREAIRACISAGIPVVFDERGAIMHNKFCVIDGNRVWTGSTNITENGFFRNDNNVIVVASPELASNFSAEFSEMFADKRFGPRSPKGVAYPVVVVDGVAFETYFAPEDNVRRELLAEIADADQTIDFMAFSFTSNEIAEAMAMRIEAGVAVRGIFESRNAGSRYSVDEFLARRGAVVRMDQNPYTMHNKVIIIDTETVITGSYNFSNNAETSNDENVLIVHSPAVAERYTRRFEALFK
jgi:phosphatidylserine/phosphatidylglycerophosphate/cardiolipin synthase-like enzyme